MTADEALDTLDRVCHSPLVPVVREELAMLLVCVGVVLGLFASWAGRMWP